MKMEFTNDYYIIVDFGKYKGKKIMEIPSEYQQWILENVKDRPKITDALKRIRRRKGVTNLIEKIKTPSYIPEMIEISAKFPPIQRPSDLDSSLFGSFIEYYTKHSLGLSIDNEPQELLAIYGLALVPDNFIMEGKPEQPNRRIEWIHRSFMKPSSERTVHDICNLSFAHSIRLDQFNDRKASHLYTYVKENEDYFKEYFGRIHLPIPDSKEQETCSKISVGCVIGIIDMISGTAIIDIKCCARDDIDSYRKQLFAYACLHYLRYKSDFHICQIYNFLTGKQFVMVLGNSCKNHAMEYIKQLGSYCEEHLKLFDISSHELIPK
jgi:uncharacterized protein (DUF3820 family)